MKTSIKKIFPLGFPWQTQDPFLFCVHHLDHYPRGNADLGPAVSLEGRNLGNDFTPKDGWRMYHGQTIPGFPAHPHRGFETITIVNKGYCDHSDSLGAAARFGHGDVQWMTAGRGVQHSEMFPLLNQGGENTLELFQIWLNLPKKDKFAEPHFDILWSENIPIVEDENGTVQVIAGSYQGHTPPSPPPRSWASDADNQVAIFNIMVRPGKTIRIPKTVSGVTRSLFLYGGDPIQLAGQELTLNHGADLNPEIDVAIVAPHGEARLLMLQGKPLNEPVAKYGPFVMNTEEELQQAMREFRLTQFGGWPWPYPDHVHGAERGRFAQYPNGTLVAK